MEQDKKFTSEKVAEFIIGLVLALSFIVAVFALIWANWTVLRASLTILFSVLIGVVFGYFLYDRFGKK